MSSVPFSPARGPIIIEAHATGPTRSTTVKLILDTGATTSLIKVSTLTYLGLNVVQATRHVQLTTGSSVEIVPVVQLTRLFALGQNRIGFPVVAHTLPESATVDGLLGLDFFRGHVLTLDFQVGSITLT